MTEYGIFNDEGLLAGEFVTREDAEADLAEHYSPEDQAHIAECCPDHPDQERDGCEECNREEDE